MKSLLPDAVADYAFRTWNRESDLLRRLRERTASMPQAGMQISAEQGQLMGLLVSALGVTRYLELGTFTGYSSIAVMSALPDTATAVCCDVSEEFTSVAREYWKEAGLDSRIELRLAPGTDSLEALVKEGAQFDFAFIDADKPNYPAYYEYCLRLVRPGGMIAIDNVLWNGQVADESDQDESTVILRELNDKLRQDPRIDLALVPIADGLTLARVR